MFVKLIYDNIFNYKYKGAYIFESGKSLTRANDYNTCCSFRDRGIKIGCGVSECVYMQECAN
jgi:hypothetical protein